VETDDGQSPQVSNVSGCKKKREQKSEARGADGPSGSNASRLNSKVQSEKPVHCLDPDNCQKRGRASKRHHVRNDDPQTPCPGPYKDCQGR